MKIQREIAKELGISKSYLSMMLSGQRRIPERLEKPLSELVHKNQLQEVPSKQRVVGSNPSRDAFHLNPLVFLYLLLPL
jgi:transcriptional regulator with XRE-family HTH domain